MDPDRAEFFIKTHTHKDGSQVNEETTQMVEKIKDAIKNQEGSQDSNSWNDLIFQFFGKEKPGRVRGYGLGMTPTRLRGSSSKSGGPSASEFSIVEGKLKEMEEKMKEIC